MSILSKITSGTSREVTDFVFLFYGNPKVGKTTIASMFPDRLMVDLEGGQKLIDKDKIKISTWAEFKDLCNELVIKKGEHKYKTIVIDTVDWLWNYCEQDVCERHSVQSLSDVGFGNGYKEAKKSFLSVIQGLSKCGFGVVMITHAKERTIKKKAVEFTIMGTTLSNQGENAVTATADFIFYCYKNDVGERVMLTTASKYHLCGSRIECFPDKMPMDFQMIKDCIEKETKPQTKGEKK